MIVFVQKSTKVTPFERACTAFANYLRAGVRSLLPTANKVEDEELMFHTRATNLLCRYELRLVHPDHPDAVRTSIGALIQCGEQDPTLTVRLTCNISVKPFTVSKRRVHLVSPYTASATFTTTDVFDTPIDPDEKKQDWAWRVAMQMCLKIKEFLDKHPYLFAAVFAERLGLLITADTLKQALNDAIAYAVELAKDEHMEISITRGVHAEEHAGRLGRVITAAVSGTARHRNIPQHIVCDFTLEVDMFVRSVQVSLARQHNVPVARLEWGISKVVLYTELQNLHTKERLAGGSALQKTYKPSILFISDIAAPKSIAGNIVRVSSQVASELTVLRVHMRIALNTLKHWLLVESASLGGANK